MPKMDDRGTVAVHCEAGCCRCCAQDHDRNPLVVLVLEYEMDNIKRQLIKCAAVARTTGDIADGLWQFNKLGTFIHSLLDVHQLGLGGAICVSGKFLRICNKSRRVNLKSVRKQFVRETANELMYVTEKGVVCETAVNGQTNFKEVDMRSSRYENHASWAQPDIFCLLHR